MYQHLLAPMDGSKLAECVLPHVEAIGGGGNVARVTLARVVTPFHLHDYAEEKLPSQERHLLEVKVKDDAREYLEQIAAQLRDKGVAAEVEVLTGDTVNELVDYTNNNGVDLIVISTHGHSGIVQMVWGSIAESLLRAACVPVLMVRAPGCVPGI